MRRLLLIDITGLKTIEGIEMSSVIFIRDYVQLVFEGHENTAILSLFEFPTITTNAVSYNIQMNGYRDVLCSIINQKLIEVMTKEETIRLIFEKDVIVQISLRDEDYEGTEVAMFKKGNEITVW